MEKHRRVKQNVETALRATKDSTAGRLLAKKMKNVLSQEKRFEKTAQSITQKPLEEEEIRLFFSDIQPLPASKVLIQLEKENLSIGDRVLVQELRLTVRGQEKIGIIGPNGIGKSTLLAKFQKLLSAKREISLGFMPQDYHKKTAIGFITTSLSQQNWGKRGTTENPISLSQSQFQLSRNAASNSLLIWRTTG